MTLEEKAEARILALTTEIVKVKKQHDEHHEMPLNACDELMWGQMEGAMICRIQIMQSECSSLKTLLYGETYPNFKDCTENYKYFNNGEGL